LSDEAGNNALQQANQSLGNWKSQFDPYMTALEGIELVAIPPNGHDRLNWVMPTFDAAIAPCQSGVNSEQPLTLFRGEP
jgi:hypothetical protein